MHSLYSWKCVWVCTSVLVLAAICTGRLDNNCVIVKSSDGKTAYPKNSEGIKLLCTAGPPSTCGDVHKMTQGCQFSLYWVYPTSAQQKVYRYTVDTDTAMLNSELTISKYDKDLAGEYTCIFSCSGEVVQGNFQLSMGDATEIDFGQGNTEERGVENWVYYLVGGIVGVIILGAILGVLMWKRRKSTDPSRTQQTSPQQSSINENAAFMGSVEDTRARNKTPVNSTTTVEINDNHAPTPSRTPPQQPTYDNVPVEPSASVVVNSSSKSNEPPDDGSGPPPYDPKRGSYAQARGDVINMDTPPSQRHNQAMGSIPEDTAPQQNRHYDYPPDETDNSPSQQGTSHSTTV